ncbi:MAG: transglutaminase domain-containing protein [Nanoarchaeota archaeon]|nr:transglutaminase domain-containing protein [Nanoarchaeota archaeon]
MEGDERIRRLILVLLLVLPVVCAEDFNTYKSLIIENSIAGDINFVEKGSDSYTDYFKADIFLFPKDNFQQSVMNQSVTTEPDYSSLSVTDNAMLLNWDHFSGDKINFKIGTDLKIKNDFPKVFKTVSFPIYQLSSDLEKYTYETDHIDINSDIKSKANEVIAGEVDLFVVVYKIGDWVKSNIKYDLNTLTAEADQKASWVFINKRGVCDEITNLFIAMLRSINIPARFVSGIVYSNLDNSFGNHGWAEVYFPGHGWIPFDVTFGQYGWVDPTHLKMDDSYDSGIPSIEYHWKSRDVEVNTGALEFKTEVKTKTGKLDPYVSMEIKPLKDQVNFGSYVPIEVVVRNLKDYYVPQTIFISKAPGLLKNENTEYFVLKPKGKKTFYWIAKVPSDLEEAYIYTSDLEVKNVFGASASHIIKYAKNFEDYSREWAVSTTERLKERESKFFFSDLELKCSSDKSSYYSVEDAELSCLVTNLGNVQLDNVNVCLAEGCKRISLGIGEKKEVSFTKSLTSSETVSVSAENEDMVRYSEVKLDVVEIPDLQVVDVEPKTIAYDELNTLTVSFVTESPAYHVRMEIKNLGAVEWKEVSDKRFLKIPFEGKIFSNGFIEIHMSYDDALNKTYVKDEQIPILVTDVPAYVRFWNWLKNLF